MFPTRYILFTVLLVVILLQIARFISTSYANGLSAGLPFRSKSGTPAHPIPQLMKHAAEKYRALLSRQSGSLRQAVAEYRRRYKRDPPKGFDDWYAFAKANKVKIIDEYDGMADDLAPFWHLPGEEIRRRVLQVSLYILSYMVF
jgi:hypothetical protein